MGKNNTLRVYKKKERNTIRFTKKRREKLNLESATKIENLVSGSYIPEFKFHLTNLLKEIQNDPVRTITKEQIFDKCLSSRSQTTKYFNTKHHEPLKPNRNILIMIGIAMQLEEHELGKLLESANFSRLDVIKSSRDRLILNCMKEKLPIININKALIDNNHAPF